MMATGTTAIRRDDPPVTAHVRQVLDQASTELDEDLLLGDEIRARVDVKPIGSSGILAKACREQSDPTAITGDIGNGYRSRVAARDQPASPRHHWSRGAPRPR